MRNVMPDPVDLQNCRFLFGCFLLYAVIVKYVTEICKVAKVSFKSFVYKKYFIEFYGTLHPYTSLEIWNLVDLRAANSPFSYSAKNLNRTMFVYILKNL